ncbi:hypothetical protein BD779DRAFT_1680609 [Infundibulicybe gibba]|nr:hypothetical protein BD779DRAFT_1680609 [Infundibulicybe gibba]
MAMTTPCPGCFVYFSPDGFSRHILNTTNPACRSIFEQIIRAAAAPDPDDEALGDSLAGYETGDEMEVNLDTSGGADGGASDDIDVAWLDHEGNQPERGSEVPDADEFPWDGEEDDEGGIIPEDDGALESDGDEEPWPPPAVPGDFDLDQSPLPAQPPQPVDENANTATGGEPVKPFVETLQSSRAGEPLPEHVLEPGYSGYKTGLAGGNNQWAPFNSKLDWELARWAKVRGPGSTAVSDLLGIMLQDKLGLSYKNSRELNQIIDTDLPNDRPRFERRDIKIAGETFDIFYRNPLECVKALFADPEFAGDLLLRPERHFADASKTDQLYHEMNTGRWWWDTQQALDIKKPGGTIVPVIISSDKTQVTLFGSKQAYPVYLTIGNIPKNCPCASGAVVNLFHACMRKILAPLTKAGIDARDYPKQLLVTGIKSTSCPKCKVTKEDLGNPTAPLENRDLEGVLRALMPVSGDPLEFTRACKHNGIKPVVHPFWEDLPYVNIYRSITSDILHQVYQGIVKHLISWIEKLYGPEEIDERCKRFPPNHHIRLFMNGISSLSRVTGREHSQMCSFLLGLIAESPSLRVSHSVSAEDQKRVVRAVKALLDFAFLSQYPVHSTTTLQQLQDALRRFHQDMDVFITVGIRTNMNFPKLHSFLHYVSMIKLFGTTDNYNTEYTERLHIDLAKDAYRATNHKNEYSQMTIWLERKKRFFGTRTSGYSPYCRPGTSSENDEASDRRSVAISRLVDDYGAKHFTIALARFIVMIRNPDLRTNRLIEDKASDLHMYLSSVPVYHVAKFIAKYPAQADDESTTLDSIHAKPARKNPTRNKEVVPGRFDTALIRDSGTATAGDGLTDYRVGQVRVIFSIPERSILRLFHGLKPPKYLAYIEWFTPFRQTPEPDHGLYRLKRAYDPGGGRLVSVIPLVSIRQSVHLFPHFPRQVLQEWASHNVLDTCDNFLLNSQTDRYGFARLR